MDNDAETTVPHLTKSDFLNYKHCEKSFWLSKHKPDVVDRTAPSQFDRLLMQDGYKVEALVKELIQCWPDRHQCLIQVSFRSYDGLFARAAMIKQIDDNAIDLYEIKASTSLKSSSGQDHVEDAAFQTLVVERAFQSVRNAFIIHVNNDYVRQGDVDPHDEQSLS